jgi:hypothetical protein
MVLKRPFERQRPDRPGVIAVNVLNINVLNDVPRAPRSTEAGSVGLGSPFVVGRGFPQGV